VLLSRNIQRHWDTSGDLYVCVCMYELNENTTPCRAENSTARSLNSGLTFLLQIDAHCMPTRAGWRFLTTKLSLMSQCVSWLTQSGSTRLVGPKPIPRACGLAYFLVTVSLCSWHCHLHSCPTGDHHWSSFWFSNKQHYLLLLEQTISPIFPNLSCRVEKNNRNVLSDMNYDGIWFSKELPHTCLVSLRGLR